MNKKFAVIGGDKRQLYLAQAIARDGYPVCLSYFDDTDTGKVPNLPLKSAILRADIVILPLPVTRDGVYLTTHHSKEKLRLDDDFANLLMDKKVYGGLCDRLTKTSELYSGIDCYDYYQREELMAGNAVLTAEGAIALALTELPASLNGSKCLVTGFGRIGKSLCAYLRGMYADVTCAARKSQDLMNIRCMDCRAVKYSDINERYDIIFNTVPTEVLTQSILSKQDSSTAVLELASPPGGVDIAAAERLGISVINGQSIPGRVSPKTSGEYIKEAIYNMMEE